MDNLNSLRDNAYEIAKSKGFYKDFKNQHKFLVFDLLAELTELNKAWVEQNISEYGLYTFSEFKSKIKDTVQDELADIIIRVLSFCGHFGIDIEFHVKEKMEFNKTRPLLHKEIQEVKSCVNCSHLEEMVFCNKHSHKVKLNNFCEDHTCE